MQGSIEHAGRQHPIDGSERTDEDPDRPHVCSGWFRCPDPDFRANLQARLVLHLAGDGTSTCRLDATVIRAHKTGPIWKHVAAR